MVFLVRVQKDGQYIKNVISQEISHGVHIADHLDPNIMAVPVSTIRSRV